MGRQWFSSLSVSLYLQEQILLMGEIMSRFTEAKGQVRNEGRLLESLLNYISLALFVFACCGVGSIVFFLFNDDKIDVGYLVYHVEQEIQEWNNGQKRSPSEYTK